MQPERYKKIRRVASQRQMDLTVCLENVHDSHNISAVLRSCDAVGISDVHILYTDPELQNQPFSAGKKSSAGSRRWVRTHIHHDIQSCFSQLRKSYDRIYCTLIREDSRDLYDLKLTESQ